MSRRVHIVVPDDLLARLDAMLDPGESRGAFVRAAVEDALRERAVVTVDGGLIPANDVGQLATVTGVPVLDATTTSERQLPATPAHGGCALHPEAGALESRGQWWCAQPGCANHARARDNVR